MTAYATYADALSDKPARTVGTLLSPLDPLALKWSCQVFDPYETGGAVWDVSFWDIDNWQALGQWVELTARVRGVAWSAGADSPAGEPKTATATVTLDNFDGAVSPWATTGAFAPYGRSYVRVGALVRFGVTSNEGGNPYYGWFAGRVETMPEDTEARADAWVDMTLVDVGADLAVVERQPLTVGVGSGESAVARFTRLMTDAEFVFPINTSAFPPVIAASTTMQPTTMGTNRLTEMRLTAASAGGRMSANAGTLYFSAPLTSYSVSPLGVFTNNPGPTELPIADLTPYASNERILNDVSASKVGGGAWELTDRPSINQFGSVSSNFGYPRTDLICNEDATVISIVSAALVAHAWDEIGVESLTVDADMSPLLWAALNFIATVGVPGRPRFTVRWVHPSLATWTLDVLVDGFSYGMTMQGPQAKLVATISTSAANPVES